MPLQDIASRPGLFGANRLLLVGTFVFYRVRRVGPGRHQEAMAPSNGIDSAQRNWSETYTRIGFLDQSVSRCDIPNDLHR
mmetsp:Transcript_12207/g.15169  ORF Transcript_12207/g.15169 Transcript_12207/m.15169 type:complete len:80 (-) Transcript_12207:64-303(-)